MFSKGRSHDSTPAPAASEARGTRPESRVPSIVSPELTVHGNMSSQGDIQVDGTVHGDVDAVDLVVGESGAIHGTVTAGTLRVRGTVDGEIRAETVNLMSSAKVYGDIIHSSLAIEAGALLEGHCRRREAQDLQAETHDSQATPAQPLYSLAAPRGESEDAEPVTAKAADGRA